MHWVFNDTFVDNSTQLAYIESTTAILNNTFQLVENASAYLIDGFDAQGIAENLSEYHFLMQWNMSHHLLQLSYVIENATTQEDDNIFVFSLGRALGRTTPLELTGTGNVTIEGPIDLMILEATPELWFPGIMVPDYTPVWTFTITSDVPESIDIIVRFQQSGGMMLAAFGSAIAIALASLGAALGIGYSGNAMIGTVRRKPEAFSKGMISVVLAEALSIYGLLCAFMVIMRVDPMMPVSEGILSIAAGIAIGLAGIGAGIGIASAGSALCWSLQYRPEAFSKALVSVVLAEALSIYGLLVSFIVIMRIGTAVTMIQVFVAVTASLTVGLGGFFAGLAIGWGGSAMTGSVERRPEAFSKSMVAVVLAEALAIYTLLVAFMLLMA
jgi:F0F1-type ATP synthase membrane subunit c/vacuolar-type H+-ATPase subunit K